MSYVVKSKVNDKNIKGALKFVQDSEVQMNFNMSAIGTDNIE